MVKARTYSLEQFARMQNDPSVLSGGGCSISLEVLTPEAQHEPLVIDAYLFVIGLNGEVQMGDVSIARGEVVGLLPNTLIDLRNRHRSLSCSFFLMAMTPSVLGENSVLYKILMPLTETLRARCKSRFEPDEQEQLFRMISSVCDCIDSPSWSQAVATLAIITLLIALCERMKDAGGITGTWGATRRETLYTHFVDLLFKHYKTEHSVTFYANEMCVSPKYLSRVVKDTCGKPAHEFISDVLVEEIAMRLRDTNETVKEISYALNFPNISFFGKFFRRKMGMSPVNYRKQFVDGD